MKYTIESSGLGPKIESSAVASYLKQNTVEEPYRIGTTFFTGPQYTIRTTPPGTGEKVLTDYGSFHVSCRKTKANNYIFDVWNA